MIDVADLFPAAARVAYFNTASMALGNRSSVAALQTALEHWASGTFDWTVAEAAGEDLRSVLASLLGCEGDDLAFVTGASGGAATVAAQLRDGRPGANVLVPEREFTSNLLAWQQLTERGYEVRLVPDSGGALTIDAFSERTDAQTAVIATSLVQSASGFRVDLDALTQLAAEHGAWLVIDASQALGCLEIDLAGVHALFSCSHKWLCGVRGMGYLYVDPELRDSFRPLTPGWKSGADPSASFYGPSIEMSPRASRLDTSSPWFDPIANLAGARIIADVGVSAIEAHVTSLLDRLEQHGVAMPYVGPHRSSIVSLEVRDAVGVLDRLADAGVVASVRAGRARVSVHLYNTPDHIDALADAIA